MDRRNFVLASSAALSGLWLPSTARGNSISTSDPTTFDVVIYGATSAGIVAAIAAKQLGLSVVLVEPSKHLGGLTTGGLGATDIGNKRAIGGLSRTFYEKVWHYYQQESAWVQEKQADYKSGRQAAGEQTMWTFEPHVASAIYTQWLSQLGIEVQFQQALDRTVAPRRIDRKILSFTTVQGKEFSGKYFIDATYEGDLMAAAKVDFTIGRESNATYSESLNGVQTAQATKHQLPPGVSAYIRPGDPASGLLPEIRDGGIERDGTGDKRVQAYCFRMCMTDFAENRIPFAPPDNYRPERYELLLRCFEAGLKQLPWHTIMMPNRKTDTNNNTGFSTDYLGASYTWGEASDQQRELIYQEHLDYQKGLMWTVTHHPRVPAEIRQQAIVWGNCRDEFIDDGGWSPQLYVREARRMVGAKVMTEHHCRGREKVTDSVGMAAYTMDSHNVQRYVDKDGFARNEGDVQVGGFPPYPISYQAILPKREQCNNLLVPVALSASHIAYGSIRMEPVFMVLGESSAHAISIAARTNSGLDEVPYETLKAQLNKANQVLE